MDRRIFLTTIVGTPLGAALNLSCAPDITVHLTKKDFDRKKVIGSDIKGNYYLRYKLPGIIWGSKEVAIRVDSTKVNQYGEGDYILLPTAVEEGQVYRKDKKKYNVYYPKK